MTPLGNPFCECLICRPGPGPSDEWIGRLSDHVGEDGWYVIGVAEEDGLPGWAYSVGLTHTFGIGEFALFGLDVPDMQEWVAELCAAVEDGRSVPEDTRLAADLTGLPALLRPMDPTWYPGVFGVAEEFYGGTAYTVRQVIWADRDGRFPWDDGAGPRCVAWQPPGWRPVDEQVPSLWRRILAEVA